jgi:hypothetical protein
LSTRHHSHKNRRSIRQVVDGVDAQDRIEGGIGKRQRMAGVVLDELCPLGQPRSLRSCGGRRDAFDLNVDAHDVASREPCHAQGGSTAPAGDIEEPCRRVEIEPRAKSVVLLRGVPTVLPNVLAATLAPDGAVDRVGETTVLLTVELRQRWLEWSLHFITWPVVHCTLPRTRALIEQKGGSYRKLRE